MLVRYNRKTKMAELGLDILTWNATIFILCKNRLIKCSVLILMKQGLPDKERVFMIRKGKLEGS